MSKHTAGPWKFHANDFTYTLKSEQASLLIAQQQGAPGADSLEIALVLSDIDALDCAANAQLIAAAPDLLEAAKGLVIWINYTWSDFPQEVAEALHSAEQAIAKAEGK